MQYVVRTRNDDFKATMHSDRTARVHTVSKDRQNSSLRQILECWYGRTGCPALLNTSLNIKGMPMVNDAEDAKDLRSSPDQVKSLDSFRFFFVSAFVLPGY